MPCDIPANSVASLLRRGIRYQLDSENILEGRGREEFESVERIGKLEWWLFCDLVTCLWLLLRLFFWPLFCTVLVLFPTGLLLLCYCCYSSTANCIFFIFIFYILVLRSSTFQLFSGSFPFGFPVSFRPFYFIDFFTRSFPFSSFIIVWRVCLLVA